MQQEQLEAIIHKLEDVSKRMSVWLKKPSDIEPFLNGFRIACHILGVSLDHDQAYWQVAIARGWEFTPAASPAHSIREKGLDDTAIAQELLRIEIEALKRRYALPNNSTE